MITLTEGELREIYLQRKGATPPVRHRVKCEILRPLPNSLRPEGSRPTATFFGRFQTLQLRKLGRLKRPVLDLGNGVGVLWIYFELRPTLARSKSLPVCFVSLFRFGTEQID